MPGLLNMPGGNNKNPLPASIPAQTPLEKQHPRGYL